jgi:quinoprotein glucose dehydrogenase
MGFLFTFDRDSGKPVFPIVERPVPQDAVPGERPSPTQPHPVAPPALARQGPVTPEDAWGLTWFDTRACRKRIESYRSKGMFQPPALQDSLMQPGNAGGSNWGGIAFDPRRQLAIANTLNLPFVVALVPREQLQAQRDSGNYDDFDFSSQRGTPYGMRRTSFTSSLGIPCVKPPWGQLTAVDMTRGTIKWQIRFDVTRHSLTRHASSAAPSRPPAAGVHAASLTIGCAPSARTVARCVGGQTAAGGQATPMTYVIGGRQYVVIAAGGYKEDSTRGDFLVAYALPR